VVLVIAIIAGLSPGGHGSKTAAPTTVPVPATTRATVATNPPSPESPVRVTEIGRPLLDVPTGWELFGRGHDLVRIQLRAGRITRTAVPVLQSTGPVFFVVGPDRVIIRPLDYVPGYVVPDGQPAAPLTGILGGGDLAFAGPDRNHLWVLDSSNDQPRLQVVGFDGQPTGVSIPLPSGAYPVGSDGAGHVLLSQADVTYLAGLDGLKQVTIGRLLAAGPGQLLTDECGPTSGCTTMVIDPVRGTRRSLGASTPPSPDLRQGVISPDGSAVAMIEDTATGPALHLVDMISGQDRPTSASLATPISGSETTMVWAPDSHMLFFVDAAGHLNIIDRAGTHIRDLGIDLPALTELGIRVAPGSRAP
jgi:hypothetical protein